MGALVTSFDYLDRARYPMEGNDRRYVATVETVARWFAEMPSLRVGLLYDLARLVRGMGMR